MTAPVEIREDLQAALDTLQDVTFLSTEVIARILKWTTPRALSRMKMLEEACKVDCIKRKGVRGLTWRLRTVDTAAAMRRDDALQESRRQEADEQERLRIHFEREKLCPKHRVDLTQIGVIHSDEGEPIGAELGCPWKDCDYTAVDRGENVKADRPGMARDPDLTEREQWLAQLVAGEFSGPEYERIKQLALTAVPPKCERCGFEWSDACATYTCRPKELNGLVNHALVGEAWHLVLSQIDSGEAVIACTDKRVKVSLFAATPFGEVPVLTAGLVHCAVCCVKQVTP